MESYTADVDLVQVQQPAGSVNTLDTLEVGGVHHLHWRHNRRRPDRTHIHMRDPRGNVRMDRLNSTKQWVSWGVGGFFWPFLFPKTIF